ncbi:MAG: hypothetical protein HQL28_04515 [Candidatus Omnitrophica bacterium]|nr:hypothetical protein [Candidatus Omnitrophota bacterium]
MDNAQNTENTRISEPSSSGYDHIDAELSKTYFKKKNPAVKKNNSKTKEKKTRSTAVKIFSVLAALSIIATVSFFFIKGKTFFLTIVSQNNAGTQNSKTFLTGFSQVNSRLQKFEIIDDNCTVFYDFENGTDEWEIPFWALEKPDHVGISLKNVKGFSTSGNSSLELDVNFPGGKWRGAYVEIAQYLDLSDYDIVAADIYLPVTAKRGLKAKFILTVGDDWRFTEMSRRVSLAPGEWTTMVADVSENSRDWRKTIVDKNFKSDIRKIGIRIESDFNPAYTGPIFIDNVRVYSKKIKPEAPAATATNISTPAVETPEQTPVKTSINPIAPAPEAVTKGDYTTQSIT